MYFLKVLYYNYYLFYTKLIKDSDPFFATLLALSFSESLLLNGIADIIALEFYCYEIKVWIQFIITISIIVINYFVFFKTEKVKKIIALKPTLMNNKILSVTIALLFFLVTASWLFWGSIYGKYLLEKCR